MDSSATSVMREVEAEINAMSKMDYDSCLKALKKFSENHFASLTLRGNEIARTAGLLPKEAIKFAIEQYSVFSREAIHMLLDAMIRNYDWPDLFKEIQENINEERGKFTKDVPHLEMMRRGYLNDLGIDTDAVDQCCATMTFVRKMRAIFNHNDNAFSAGALLAFEGHAIQEFHIVDTIIDAYREKLPETSLTKLYINGHKDFEIEHEAHLSKSIKPYINEKNIRKMCIGFLSVSLCMEIWWQQLFVEVGRVQFEQTLVIKDETEEFDIMKRFVQI